jgi:hypothetical protein
MCHGHSASFAEGAKDLPSYVLTTKNVSVYKLLSATSAIDGKEIGTVGYLRLQEGEFGSLVGELWASRCDADDGFQSNAVVVSFAKEAKLPAKCKVGGPAIPVRVMGKVSCPADFDGGASLVSAQVVLLDEFFEQKK